jgi:predicted transcriptional regulator
MHTLMPPLSLRYLVRILAVLLDHDEVTITNLAMMSRVNHRRCREVVGMMRDSGYARTTVRRKKQYVGLTESGYRYGKRLLELGAMTRLLGRIQGEDLIEDTNDIRE